jgi:hypothetical protein
MNTTKLVVGQDVYVVSDNGPFFRQGKVVAVTPDGVEVLTAPHVLDVGTLSQFDYDVDQLSWVIPMQFDNEGNNGSDEHDGQDVYGFGPWHIDDVPFAERKALHEQAGITKQKEVTVDKSR